MKVSIVVLNFNGLNNTLDCIKSLEKADKGNHRVEIIIVDNNSQDGSKKVLKKLKNIHFISLKENTGFAGGNNVGIKEALKRNSDAVLILNNDTIVSEKFLIHLVNSLKKAQIISPKIYFASGFEYHKKYSKKDLGKVIWYAGGKIDWENILGTHLGVDEVDTGQFQKTCKIDFATGACMLIKRTVFEEIGFFDEKYFLYLEDLDFSVRAAKKGFKIFFEPKAIIWHKNAGSAGGSGSELQDYFITRNRLIFAAKHAKIRTKIAVLKQIFLQINNPQRRRALFDFLSHNFGQGSYLK